MITSLVLTPNMSGQINTSVGPNPVGYTPDVSIAPPVPIVGADEIDLVCGVAGVMAQATANTTAPNFAIALWTSLNSSSGFDDLAPNLPANPPSTGTAVASWVCVGTITVNATGFSGPGPYVYSYPKAIVPAMFTGGASSPMLNAIRWSVHFTPAPSGASFLYQGLLTINGLARRKNF